VPQRFSGLLSWPILNQILEHHWRETYRFRSPGKGAISSGVIYRRGRPHKTDSRERGTDSLLRRDFVLDAIDEVHGHTHLAQSFEAFFRGGTKINIYAGWRACYGPDLHRDNQEIFIAQLDGRKLNGDGFNTDDVDRSQLRRAFHPAGRRRIRRDLTPGDLLYIRAAATTWPCR
jgi:hypothetical protein